MSRNSNDFSQFELFPGSSKQAQNSPTFFPKRFWRNFTLTTENCIICLLVIIVLSILAFSVGVENGKKIAGRVEINPLQETDSALRSSTSEVGQQQKIVVTVDANHQIIPQEKIEVFHIPDMDIENETQQPAIDNPYTIQVASFKLKENAQKEADKLGVKGFKAMVIPKGEHSIVVVGKFPAKQEALDYSNKLKNSYKDCLVRRL